MKRSCAKSVMLSVFFVAFIFVGCGDDGAGPGDNNETPSEELEHSWSARFGDAEEQSGLSTAFDPFGNTVVVGTFWGGVDFGGGLLTSAGREDIFVAKFGPDGTHLWSDRFGDRYSELACYLATDPSGNVLLAGRFCGTIDFGGGTLTSGGNDDIFVAKLDPDGTHLWSDSFGDASAQYANAVAADVSGNVAVAGYLSGSVDFGGGVLTSAGSFDILVARFSAGGSHLWSDRFGDDSTQYPRGVAAGPAGAVSLTGSFQGTVDFGGGVLTSSAGSNDIFIVRLEP